MAETVGQHSVAAFTSPVNGTSPIDANTVKGNDNTIRSAYVDHDADPGIHVQSSTLASRPVANSAGRKWMTQDSGVIRLFYDDGTSWYEVDYLRTTGGTISGNLAITGTLAVTGVATFTAQPILSSLTASRAVFTDGSKGLVSNAITGTGDVVMSASPTLTGTITAASATLSGTLGVSGLLTFASLKGTGATTVTNILDEDNMASDSATALATQQSIKAYVDAQVGASDALSEVLAIGNTTGANDIIVSAGQKIRTPAVAAQDGSSAITIANTTGALTLATALADSNLATISTAGKVSNSATTATDANTASAIVARDASGNFTAGTITAALTGNASTATTLQTARNINGVSFNGSADITVTAAAGTLTGTTLASNVTASSLTSVGTLANLTVTNPITGSVTGSSGSTTGNAATATALQTARNINGVSFNGTADITVTAAAGTLTGTTLASGVTASSLTSVGTLSSLTVSGVLTLQSQTTLPANVRSFNIAATTAAQQFMHIGTSGSDAYIGTAASTGGGLITGSQAYAMEFRNDTGFSFGTGATERMRLDSSGNLGIGVTPSGNYTLQAQDNVSSGFKGFRLGGFRGGASGTGYPWIGYNIRPTSSSDVYNYDAGDVASAIRFADSIRFYTAPSGTAGNAITFTQAMTLDASGNLGINTTSGNGKLSVRGAGTTSSTYSFEAANSAGNTRFIVRDDGTSIFYGSSGPETMRLDASGNLGLGVTPSAWDTAVFRTVQIGTGAGSASLSGRADGAKDMVLASNVYYGAGSFRYIANGVATTYRTDGGSHAWASHPSGTAGNALGTATGTMTLDASGNLGVGVSSMAGSGNVYLAAGKYLGYSATTYMTPEDNVQGARIKTPGGIVLEAGGSERARFTAAGELFIGATAASGASRLVVAGSGASGRLAKFLGDTAGDLSNASVLFSKFDNNSTTSQVFLQFAVANDSIANGQINANGSGAAAFGSWSDVRLKNNVVDLSSQWDNVKALRPVEFDYIEEAGGGHQIGFIAQEVKEIYPDVVGERADGMLTLSGMSKNEARLIKALQEAMTRIESLEARLAALES